MIYATFGSQVALYGDSVEPLIAALLGVVERHHDYQLVVAGEYEAAAEAARSLARRASDPGLRAALERLGANVHARAARRATSPTATNPNSTEPASPS